MRLRQVPRIGLLIGLVVGLAMGESRLAFMAAVLLLFWEGNHWWGRRALDRVEAQRQVTPGRVFVGEECELILTIENNKLLPVPWLRVEDGLPLSFSVDGVRVARHNPTGRGHLTSMLSLRWHERVTRRYRLKADARGLFYFGPLEAYSGDPLGLDTEETRFETERPAAGEALRQVVVYPRLYDIPMLPPSRTQPYGNWEAESWLYEDPLNIAGIREYEPGDEVSRIHWLASARSGTLYSKIYNPTFASEVVLLLDGRTMPSAWQGVRHQVFEGMVELVASLAQAYQEAGEAVGFYANAAATGYHSHPAIPPDHRSQQMTHILEALARVRPQALCPLSLVFQEIPAMANLQVVLVTSLWDEETVDAVKEAIVGGLRVWVMFVPDDSVREVLASGKVAAWQRLPLQEEGFGQLPFDGCYGLRSAGGGVDANAHVS